MNRLAASEIAKFQDQLIKRLIDDMSSQMETLSPSTGAITVSTHQLTPGVVYDYDWNFARAFLYSLTVLTTIGEFLNSSCCSPQSIHDCDVRIFSVFRLSVGAKTDTSARQKGKFRESYI